MKAMELITRRNAAYEKMEKDCMIAQYAAGASHISVEMLLQIEIMENSGMDAQQILQTMKDNLNYESGFYIKLMEV